MIYYKQTAAGCKIEYVRTVFASSSNMADIVNWVHFGVPSIIYRTGYVIVNTMSESESIEIGFSKKVDEKGRLVIPKEHREALTIDGREALVEFTAKKVTYLDEDDGGEQ